MNVPAHIADVEIEAFSDPSRSFIEAVRDLERTSLGASEESIFEHGIRLKGIIDAHEDVAKREPSWAVLSVLLNCETRLWHLYHKTSIRYNPFLVHWVETVQRLEIDTGAHVKTSNTLGDCPTTTDVVWARIECIRRLLTWANTEDLTSMRPRQLCNDIITTGWTSFHGAKTFNVKPFIDMLVEEGIYDKTPDFITHHDSRSDPLSHSKDNLVDSGVRQPESISVSSPRQASTYQRMVGPHRLAPTKEWRQDMDRKLTYEPNTALQELTRLPLELPFLDYLNELLQLGTLKSHKIDPATIITGYIQHSLRIIERMGSLPSPSGSDLRAMDDRANGVAAGEMIWEYGQEAQSRFVRLLLLFIKNLIRKDLLSPEILYFEIQEICVRYVWIKEVRDFRFWVEEGSTGVEGG
ncbi:hypothetical protein ACN47E_002503 [Coniothyrium glycines]